MRLWRVAFIYAQIINGKGFNVGENGVIGILLAGTKDIAEELLGFLCDKNGTVAVGQHGTKSVWRNFGSGRTKEIGTGIVVDLMNLNKQSVDGG